MSVMSPPQRETPRDQFVATVGANVPLCREHFRLVFRLSDFPPTDPGQFVQIACRDLAASVHDGNGGREVDWAEGRPITLAGHELREPVALLRRPFSLAGRRDTAAGVELDIIH